MEFILWFTEREGALAPPEGGGMVEMKKLSGELASAGKLRRGAPLGPVSDQAVVRVRSGKALVSDGPYAESKEQMGGFYIIDAPDLDSALDWAGQASAACERPIEVRPADSA